MDFRKKNRRKPNVSTTSGKAISNQQYFRGILDVATNKNDEVEGLTLKFSF
jgi:hypothetical protein